MDVTAINKNQATSIPIGIATMADVRFLEKEGDSASQVVILCCGNTVAFCARTRYSTKQKRYLHHYHVKVYS